MPIRKVIDSNILVYALNQSHPAYLNCSEFLQNNDLPDVLYSIQDVLSEIYHALTMYYIIPPKVVVENIKNVLDSNINFYSLSEKEVANCLDLAVLYQLDLTDCKLYYLAQKLNAPIIITDDKRFGTFIKEQGLLWETPITTKTRQEIDRWEETNLPRKGLPRILSFIYQYIFTIDKNLAQKFKVDTKYFQKIPNII